MKSRSAGEFKRYPLTPATRVEANMSRKINLINGSQVDVWIERLVFLNTCSDFHDDYVGRRPILEMMAVAISGRANIWVLDKRCTSVRQRLDQLRFAADTGACGIFMRSLPGSRKLRGEQNLWHIRLGNDRWVQRR